jgi:hypothetical protein
MVAADKEAFLITLLPLVPLGRRTPESGVVVSDAGAIERGVLEGGTSLLATWFTVLDVIKVPGNPTLSAGPTAPPEDPMIPGLLMVGSGVATLAMGAVVPGPIGPPSGIFPTPVSGVTVICGTLKPALWHPRMMLFTPACREACSRGSTPATQLTQGGKSI